MEKAIDVLEVVEFDTGDVHNMTADELKLKLREQIDASVDKYYRDHVPTEKEDDQSTTHSFDVRDKFNLSKFYSREPKQSIQAI